MRGRILDGTPNGTLNIVLGILSPIIGLGGAGPTIDRLTIGRLQGIFSSPLVVGAVAFSGNIRLRAGCLGNRGSPGITGDRLGNPYLTGALPV